MILEAKDLLTLDEGTKIRVVDSINRYFDENTIWELHRDSEGPFLSKCPGDAEDEWDEPTVSFDADDLFQVTGFTFEVCEQLIYTQKAHKDIVDSLHREIERLKERTFYTFTEDGGCEIYTENEASDICDPVTKETVQYWVKCVSQHETMKYELASKQSRICTLENEITLLRTIIDSPMVQPVGPEPYIHRDYPNVPNLYPTFTWHDYQT